MLLAFLFTFSAYAEYYPAGQNIQIHTQLSAVVGKPRWLLIIRDIDHQQMIPYVFEVQKKDNFWVAATQGKHYLITVSQLQIETYQSSSNRFKKFKTNNFCSLESNGRIHRGDSITVNITGKLSPRPETYHCQINIY
jgi:hypothetical protein